MDIKAFEDLIKTEISAVITKVFDDIPTSLYDTSLASGSKLTL